MVSKILEKDSGARRDGSEIRVFLAAMLANVQFNKKDILIIDLPYPSGVENPPQQQRIPHPEWP
jgi:hypothetical protein